MTVVDPNQYPATIGWPPWKPDIPPPSPYVSHPDVRVDRAKRRIQQHIGPQVLTLIVGDKITVTPKGEVEIDMGTYVVRMDASIAQQLADRLRDDVVPRALDAAAHYSAAVKAAKGD